MTNIKMVEDSQENITNSFDLRTPDEGSQDPSVTESPEVSFHPDPHNDGEDNKSE